MKDFLKPTIWKIILTVILFVLITFSFSNRSFGGPSRIGVPFSFYSHICLKVDFTNCNESFNIFYLLLDLIISYLISCL